MSWLNCVSVWFRISALPLGARRVLHSMIVALPGSVVECRTPEREVRGSKPTAAVLCPWARHFTPRKYWLLTQEAMAPSRYDWKIVDWDVKPQHNQPTLEVDSGQRICLGKSLFEPAHEIIVLFVLRKLILQTRMCSHPVELDVWFFMYVVNSVAILLGKSCSPGSPLVLCLVQVFDVSFLFPTEPSHEIRVLFVLHKLTLQTRRCSHPVGLDVWFLIGPFVCFHTSCVRTAKALARQCGCAGLLEPSLVAYVIRAHLI